jgi:glutamate dehydrogenase/leucine dehydrogenase
LDATTTPFSATIYDRPERPVPIYISAGGGLVAKYAGRAGDGFICTSGKARELYTETLLPNLEAGLADAWPLDGAGMTGGKVAKRIVIVGAGAVGGYFGAHLSLGGYDVTVIDPWPEHIEVIRAKGLSITGMTAGSTSRGTSVSRARNPPARAI